MQGRIFTAWYHACRAIPDSLGYDGESLCQGTPQKWASAYFVAHLSFLSQGTRVTRCLKVSDPS